MKLFRVSINYTNGNLVTSVEADSVGDVVDLMLDAGHLSDSIEVGNFEEVTVHDVTQMVLSVWHVEDLNERYGI